MPLFLAALACGTLTACGGERSELTQDGADRLQGHLAAVRGAARAGDVPTARDRLSAFLRLVAREERAGRLSPADAMALETGARQARRRIEIEVERRDEAPVTDVAEEPAQPPGEDDAEEATGDGKGHPGKGNGKGKGKGKAKGKGKP